MKLYSVAIYTDTSPNMSFVMKEIMDKLEWYGVPITKCDKYRGYFETEHCKVEFFTGFHVGAGYLKGRQFDMSTACTPSFGIEDRIKGIVNILRNKEIELAK